MNNLTATKKSFLIVFLTAITVVSIIGFSRAKARLSDPQQDEQDRAALEHDRAALVQALRRGGMREAAKLKGHYVGEWDPHWDWSQLGVESLTKNSFAVVVGVMTKKLGGRLSPEGRLIFTDYEVTVQETIKGNIPSEGTITVALAGGRIEFEDGTSAELRTPTFEHMKKGGTYTIFLSESTNAPGGYTLTAGPQGLVEMEDNGKVKSKGRPTDPIHLESKDKDKNGFLEEVRRQARNWPTPGKCCN